MFPSIWAVEIWDGDYSFPETYLSKLPGKGDILATSGGYEFEVLSVEVSDQQEKIAIARCKLKED